MSAVRGWGVKKLCSRKETRGEREGGRLEVKGGRHSWRSWTMRVRFGWAVARAMASWPAEPPIWEGVRGLGWEGKGESYVDDGDFALLGPVEGVEEEVDGAEDVF